jgi:hypothetical protein
MLGFDCRMTEGRSHAHEAYRHSDDNAFVNWLPAWRGWRAAAEKLGVRIVNAAPDSAIDEFDKTSLTEELRS